MATAFERFKLRFAGIIGIFSRLSDSNFSVIVSDNPRLSDPKTTVSPSWNSTELYVVVAFDVVANIRVGSIESSSASNDLWTVTIARCL